MPRLLRINSSDVSGVNRRTQGIEPHSLRARTGIRSSSRKPLLFALFGTAGHSEPACVCELSAVPSLLEREGVRTICTVCLLDPTTPWFKPVIVIRYPHALHHLELLQHAQFRSEIAKDEWREFLNQKQFDHWRTWFVFCCSLISPRIPLTYATFLLISRRDPPKPDVENVDTNKPGE